MLSQTPTMQLLVPLASVSAANTAPPPPPSHEGRPPQTPVEAPPPKAKAAPPPPTTCDGNRWVMRGRGGGGERERGDANMGRHGEGGGWWCRGGG